MTPTPHGDPDPRWLDRFPDQAALQEHLDGWQVGEGVPDDMIAVLRVTRELLLQSYLDYQFALVAVTWSLLALEAGLYVCLAAEGRKDLGRLIQQARQRELITDDEAEVLHGVRNLRNQIVHGALIPSFTPAAAVEMVGAIHEAVSDIYHRASSL